MSGLLPLIGLILRSERWLLPIWIGGITLLTVASSAAVISQFGSPSQQAVLLAPAAANPAFRFLRGVPSGLGTGPLVFFQIFTYLAALGGLMTTFMVVRHTRADEERGRTELLGATPVGRLTPLVAALVAAGIANALLAIATALGLALPGLPWQGSLLTGLAVFTCGLTFAGIGAAAAQVMPTSRGANGVAAGAVGAAYLLRGIGDALAQRSADAISAVSAWPSWLSPIGWGQRVAAYSRNDPRPLAIGVVAGLVFAAIATATAANRDLGRSLVRERDGRELARATLSSPLGLAWRLHWPALLGWAIAATTMGALAGLLAPAVADAFQGDAQLMGFLGRLFPGSRGGLLDIFVASILGFAGFLAAAAGAQATMRLRSEESEGRAELLLAAPIDRSRWLLAHVAVAVASIAAVLLPAGGAAAIAFAAGGEQGRLGSSLAAALAQVPAALVFVGVVAVVFAVAPRLTVPLGWTLLGGGLIVGEYGGLLQLPTWLQDVSPFRHTSAVPAADLDVPATLMLIAIAAAACALAAVLIRHRDVLVA